MRPSLKKNILPIGLFVCACLSMPGFAQAAGVSASDSVRTALEFNPKLKAIQENRQVMLSDVDRARAGWLPRVDVTASGGMSQQSTKATRAANYDDNMHRISETEVILSQTLWDGLGTKNRVDASKSRVDSVENRVLDNASSIALDAIIAHVDVIRRREIVRLAEKNVVQHRVILGHQNERLQSGASTIADVTQTKGRLARAQSSLSDSVSALRSAEAMYERVVGKPAPKDLEQVAPSANPLIQLEQLLQTAMVSNPQIKAYSSDVSAYSSDREVLKSAFHPLITAEAGTNYADQGRVTGYSKGQSVVLKARWNLLNGGADKANFIGAGAKVRQTRQELYTLSDALGEQVRATWAQYLSAREQENYYSEAVQYNTQTRDAFMQQFVVGQRSLIDVLDTESELFNSASQLETAKGNVVVGGFRLLAFAGVLLDELGISAAALQTVPAAAPR